MQSLIPIWARPFVKYLPTFTKAESRPFHIQEFSPAGQQPTYEQGRAFVSYLAANTGGIGDFSASMAGFADYNATGNAAATPKEVDSEA
jgi:hypothetical protein